MAGSLTSFRDKGLLLSCKQSTMDCAGAARDGSVLVPDQVIARFLHESGLNTSYPTVSRIIAKTTQKFINDVASSALAHAAFRTNQNPEEPDSKFTLTLDDLYKAVEEYDDSLLVPPKAQYFH
ncbi:transcription initiation factor TFIID subunit [Nesidiocoris tenuis]|uniref:Transcription initiation factor TFIID subunit n=1 Tax=Nesidiocoris tenuis TaxID=355587 RepID=A0ABN7AEK6_9HEMI|nr:transcription initiation factor TFIID subunit [Nesidiocoris tenuis]